MSKLEQHIEYLIQSIATSDYMENIHHHLVQIKIQAEEARELISRIGTIGAERTDIILRAERWLNENP